MNSLNATIVLFYLNCLELISVKNSWLDPVEIDSSAHLIDLSFNEALGKTLHHLSM